MGKKLLLILRIIFICIILMLLNTFLYINRNSLPKNKDIYEYSKGVYPNAIENLEGALKIKTVSSFPLENTDFTYFPQFIEYLKITYPEIFKICKLNIINNYGLLIKWEGKNKNLNPIVLTAHYDTVSYGSKVWHDNENIYGNGTIDDKGSLIAIMESVNSLIKENFEPERDIYLAFGFDEEIGGTEGALKIVEFFSENNIIPDFVLDEGQPVFKVGNKKISVIGIGEKGGVEARITAYKKGGHATIPMKETSVTLAADAIKKMAQNPPNPTLNDQNMNYLKNNVNNFDFVTNFLVANQVLLKPLLYAKIKSDPALMVNMGMTSSITITWASERRNIIPDEANFISDFRIMPGQSQKDVENYLKTIFKKDLHISYALNTFVEPKELSNTDSHGFFKLKKVINTIYNDTNAFPHFIAGGGDSRYYREISDSVYRFLPAVMTAEEYGLMHSNEEYISIDNFTRMINFYKILIKNYDEKER